MSFLLEQDLLYCLYTSATSNKVDRDADQIQEELMVMIDHEGNCTLTYVDFYKSTCEIDVTFFPFDEQACKQQFGSWNFDERYLQLKVNDPDAIGDRSEYEKNGEWEMAQARLVQERVSSSIAYPSVLVTNVSLGKVLYLLIHYHEMDFGSTTGNS